MPREETVVGVAYLFIGVDVLAVFLAYLPMSWARRRPGLRWLYAAFLLLVVAILIGVLGTAAVAQSSNPTGALVVLVYLGPAVIVSAVRLIHEGRQVRRRGTPPPRATAAVSPAAGDDAASGGPAG